jgi:hypothetical protein
LAEYRPSGVSRGELLGRACAGGYPGLTACLMGKTPAALESPTDPATGRLVETFVFAEPHRQLTWTATDATLFHLWEI